MVPSAEVLPPVAAVAAAVVDDVVDDVLATASATATATIDRPGQQAATYSNWRPATSNRRLLDSCFTWLDNFNH